jgi:hypothetical protein
MNEFIELVAKMRSAQKHYFKFKDREWLIESKRLESEVDRFSGQHSTHKGANA